MGIVIIGVTVWCGVALGEMGAGSFLPPSLAGATEKGLAIQVPKGSRSASKPKIVKAFGKIPLHFEKNRGQAPAAIQFLARGPGYQVALTSTGSVVALNSKHRGGAARPGKRPASENSLATTKGAVQISLVGSHATPQGIGQAPLPGKVHYLRGHDPAQWHTNIQTYAAVRYPEVYPGIDLVYHGRQQHLEFDFEVKPGVDPGIIRMALTSIPSQDSTHPAAQNGPRLTLTEDGDVVVELGEKGEHVTVKKPQVYQRINGHRRHIGARYVLAENNLSKKNKDHPLEVSFLVDRYDARYPLIIDPVLSYATYLGGSNLDDGSGIAVDPAGNVYVTGETSSPEVPGITPTQGPDDQPMGDAYVLKLNPTGSEVIYLTVLGGTQEDSGGDIVVDAVGSAYVAGETSSLDFPTVNALQPAFGGGLKDVFVAKLNPTGSVLIYSTYLGGEEKSLEMEGGIAIDAVGNAYVTGGTDASDFPTTVNAFQPNLGLGGDDAFVSKLNPAGSALVYSTFLGGSGTDYGSGIAVDAVGNAYIAGFSPVALVPFPTTVNALQPTNPSMSSDRGAGFVAKLNPTGSALVYSTFLGGVGATNSIEGIAVDAAGNAYVAGTTDSPDFPTVNSLKPAPFLQSDGFVAKLNPTGSALVYSTILGGSSYDGISGLAIDEAGNAYVTGFTSSPDFPTINTLQPKADFDDAFVTKISPTGNAILYSTFLGGGRDEFGDGIAVDILGNAYVTGETRSHDFPTVNALQPVFGGDLTDGFVVKIMDTGTTDGPMITAKVFPSSRAVDIGTVATAFATITNSGTSPALGCSITPFTPVPGATFLFAPLNPITNALSGAANMPVDIPAGLFQKFLISYTPTAPFDPIDVQFNFDCANTMPAPIAGGINTLLVSVSSAPVADIVTTNSAPGGVLTLPSATESGVFLVTSTNMGASDLLTMSANTGSAMVPVDLLVCEFDATMGTCKQPPSPTVTQTINAGETTFFAVFVFGQGSPVPLMPGTIRVFVPFQDTQGVERGVTSVALEVP